MRKTILMMLTIGFTMSAFAQNQNAQEVTKAATKADLDNSTQLSIGLTNSKAKKNDDSIAGLKVGIRKNFSLAPLLYTSSALAVGIENLEKEESSGNYSRKFKQEQISASLEQRLGLSFKLNNTMALRPFAAISYDRGQLKTEDKDNYNNLAAKADVSALLTGLGLELSFNEQVSLEFMHKTGTMKYNYKSSNSKFEAKHETSQLNLNISI